MEVSLLPIKVYFPSDRCEVKVVAVVYKNTVFAKTFSNGGVDSITTERGTCRVEHMISEKSILAV